MSKHVAIIGAGILGLLSARELLADGWRVTLYETLSEAEYARSTSFVAGGMIAPYSEMETAEPLILDWGREALKIWPEILADLPEPVFFRRNGTLIISHQRDRAHFEQLTARILNVSRSDDLRMVEASDFEPELEKSFGQSLYLPDEAHVDNRALMPVLLHALQKKGVRINFGEEVLDIQPNVVTSTKGTLLYDLSIDCRGIGARNSLPKLRGVRGEAFLLYAPAVGLNRPIRLMHPRYAVYIVPRDRQTYYVGATSVESASSASMSVRSSLELLSAAYSVHRGFGEATILESLTGVRPAFPDHIPQIFFEAGRIRMNGLYRHGFLLAPMLARSLKLFLQDKPVLHGERLFTFS